MNVTSLTREIQLPGLRRLWPAELGKHKILLAAIMRMARSEGVPDYQRALALPYRLLADIEAGSPAVAAAVLAMPQFGAWASECVRRLLTGAGSEPEGVPLAIDLGHLALFTAVAAVRAGQAFDLEVPLRAGTACFPGAGTARPGAIAPWEWGRAWLDGTRCRVKSSVSTVEVADGPRWSGLHRFVAAERGLILDVVLDDSDPFLDRYGDARVRVAGDDVPRWRELLGQSWQILARDHYPLAALTARTVRTLVPLAQPGPTRAAGATEMSSFGAVAMSLPADALSMAEALVHETHHAILGAVMDIESLAEERTDFLAYAPWREDPRPVIALLQGTFSHYGMGRFWGQRYRSGPPADRLRAAVEFGRLTGMVTQAAETLAHSGKLTEAGNDLVASIQAEARDWLGEPLPREAREYIADLAADHEVRWRLSHLVPDPEAVRMLADAWRRGAQPPVPLDAIATRLASGPLPEASANLRSYLMSLRYKSPGLLRELLSADDWAIGPADSALVKGDYEAAAASYLGRIAAEPEAPDIDAWTGLAAARRRTGPAPTARLFTGRPELLMALHQFGDGGISLPDDLARWLAGAT